MSDPEDALEALANAAGGDQSPPSPASCRPESPVSPIPKPAPEAVSGRPESPVSGSGNDLADLAEASASASASAMAQLSGTESAAYDPAAASISRQHVHAKPDVGMILFREAAVPVLITVGLVMLVLGLWGVMIKLGNTSLPMADRPDAGKYAIVGMVGLPIGLLLWAGAGFFFVTVRKDKAKLAKWQAMYEQDE